MRIADTSAVIALERILVATDFSDQANAALSWGLEFAGRFGAALHVLHVPQNPYIKTFGAENFAAIAPGRQRQIEEDARRHLDEWLAAAKASGSSIVPAVLTSATPALAIVDYARDHDINLIVMGTHGRDALARLVVGSVAARVVRLAPCPVLTLKNSEHDSPSDAPSTVTQCGRRSS
jgi:nucleotide-binding universal stress UspA family protein